MKNVKKFLATTLVILGLVVAQFGSALAAPTRYWTVDMSTPEASSSNRSLYIAYNVFSTLTDDNDFIVELFENTVSKGTQAIAHANGDSGAFSVNIPANGTYTYKVVATNVDASETKESDAKTVQVVDGPAPNVVTVNTATTSSTAGTGSGGRGGAEGSGVAGDSDGDGIVDEEAASTDKEANDVLGDSDKEDDKNDNQGWGNTIAVIILLLAISGGYYYMVMRRANKD